MEVKLIKNTDSENAVIGKRYGHEQILFVMIQQLDSKQLLPFIIGIGTCIWEVQMWSYQNEAEALNDVLRLSKGMTYKNAISGLNLGGGKAVIIGNSRTDKTEALFRGLVSS